MNTQYKALVLACAASVAISGAAMADTATLNPTFDAYATAGDNDYFTTFLQVENGTGENKARAYMKFDLSSIPEGSTINSVSLKLYLTQVPVAQSGGFPRPTSSQSYDLFKSSNVVWTDSYDCLYDGVGVPCSSGSAVPLTTNLVSQSTGTTVNTDVTWTHANLQTAVQQSLDSVADDDWISLVVNDPSTSTRYQGRFASNETAGNADQQPRLIVDYTPPADDCLPGDEELRFTRNDYEGPNPIQWVDAYGDHWFTITFEVDAICADFSNIKVQGGMASNLKIWTYAPLVGSMEPKAKGKGNQVLTWNIPSLAASDAPAQLLVDVSANFNEKGKAACGVKNLTGDWSAIGWWDDNGFPTMATDQVGSLVVDIGCPTP